jgi:hypothetical protein
MSRLLPLLLCCVLFAQDKEELFVITATTKLVQVNVVATDKRGESVTDLRPEDFAVFDKGIQQKIAFFGRIRSAC